MRIAVDRRGRDQHYARRRRARSNRFIQTRGRHHMRFEIGEWKLQRRGNARRRGEMNDERRREFVEDAGDARGVTQVVELDRVWFRKDISGVALH